MTSEQLRSGADIFECQNCGQCCHGFGGTYVSRENVKSIAAYLGVDSANVIKQYCRPSGGGKMVLGQKPDGYCVFREKICIIHPVKPRMCKAWPFIESVLADPENWRIMADSCPGMKADVSESTLLACVRVQIDLLDTHNAILQQPHNTKRSR